MDLLRRIGEELHQGRGLRVHAGGQVWPDGPLSGEIQGQVLEGVVEHGQAGTAPRTEGSAARQGQGPAGRGTAEGQGAASTAASVLGRAGVDTAEVSTEGVIEAYPQFASRSLPHGVILMGNVQPIAGLLATASLVVAVPSNTRLPVRAWAWWDDGFWVGPRHTNFGDGSICAFELTDGTWARARPLVELMDLYCCWLARQVHLRYLKFWPGMQVLHTVHERLSEHRSGELCGGCASQLPYVECHRAGDLATPQHERVREFRTRVPKPARVPPLTLAQVRQCAFGI